MSSKVVRGILEKRRRALRVDPDKKEKDLSDLSKQELAKIKRFFKSKFIIDIPVLDKKNPVSALVIRCLLFQMEISEGKIRYLSANDLKDLFEDRLNAKPEAVDVFGEFDAMLSKQFGSIKRRVVREVEAILKGEIKRIKSELKKKGYNMSLLNLIASKHSEIQQDIIYYLLTRDDSLHEIISGWGSLDEGTSVEKISARLKDKYSMREIHQNLNPSSSLYDSGLVDITDSNVAEASTWGNVYIETRILESHEGHKTEREPIWFEWKKVYEPSKTLSQVILPEKDKKFIQTLIGEYNKNRELGKNCRLTFLFQGPPGTGKTMTSEAIAHALGMSIIRIQTGEIEQKNIPNIISYAIARAKNKSSMLLFEECENILWKSVWLEMASPWMKILFENFNGVACFTTNYRAPDDFLRRVTYSTNLKLPSTSARTEIFKNELGKLKTSANIDARVTHDAICELTSKYNVPGGYFQQVLQLASALSSGSEIDEIHLNEAFETVELQLVAAAPAGPKEGKYQIKDLQVDADSSKKIYRFIRHCKLEVGSSSALLAAPKSMLLFGPPGTGKTMAAEAIARELGKKILKITPSSILSKYVGETEKMIKELFGEAKKEGHILFIDEAEGLLTNREAANASWERTQADEFLQQLENFTGIIIAATNWTSMMDPAFARRFIFHLKFDLPKAEVRFQIWKNYREMVPAFCDVELLANRYELSGGEIRNIVIKIRAFEVASQDEVFNLCEQQMSERTGISTRRIGFL